MEEPEASATLSDTSVNGSLVIGLMGMSTGAEVPMPATEKTRSLGATGPAPSAVIEWIRRVGGAARVTALAACQRRVGMDYAVPATAAQRLFQSVMAATVAPESAQTWSAGEVVVASVHSCRRVLPS